MDGIQMVTLLGSLAFIVAVLLLKIPPIRRWAVRWATAYADQLIERAKRQPEDEDPLVVQFREARRRERMYADLQRLRRLLATDERMSATRQQGNRIAYAWLVREQQRLYAAGSWFAEQPEPDLLTSPAALTSRWGARGIVRSPVEILEIGGRR